MRDICCRTMVTAVAAVGFATASLAAPDCRNGLFPPEGAKPGLARITGEEKAFLSEDSIYCPSDKKDCPVCPRDEACRSKTYLIPGDLVITAQSFGGHRCVLFHNPKNHQDYAGYLPEERLALQPAQEVSFKDWPGEWRNGDNYIRLRARGEKLVAKGEAFWPSANPSRKDAPGGPHLGEMSGAAAPAGDKVSFADSEDICHVSLTLLQPYLLAKDNGECGGANVSFNGVYTRAPAGRKR